MMDLFAKIVKDFQPFTISAKIFPSHRMFDKVLNKLYIPYPILSFWRIVSFFHSRSWYVHFIWEQEVGTFIYWIYPCEEKHLRWHIPVSVSCGCSVVSLFFLQNWITAEQKAFYIKENCIFGKGCLLKGCIRRRRMPKRYAIHALFPLSCDYLVVWTTMLGNKCFIIAIYSKTSL